MPATIPEDAPPQQETAFEAALRRSDRYVPAEQQILAAYQQLRHWKTQESGSDNPWIPLSDIAVFSDIADDEWSRALTALSRTPGIHLIPEENQKVLTDSDRASAVTIGDQPKHLIAVDPK
ncbi:hypothetical protein FIV07_28100 (plasmid) [Mycobacterium sp. THAF192]|nr:hypothetical protein FIV07_28100 [Mycobacterium sp. THAF192]